MGSVVHGVGACLTATTRPRASYAGQPDASDAALMLQKNPLFADDAQKLGWPEPEHDASCGRKAGVLMIAVDVFHASEQLELPPLPPAKISVDAPAQSPKDDAFVDRSPYCAAVASAAMALFEFALKIAASSPVAVSPRAFAAVSAWHRLRATLHVTWSPKLRNDASSTPVRAAGATATPTARCSARR